MSFKAASAPFSAIITVEKGEGKIHLFPELFETPKKLELRSYHFKNTKTEGDKKDTRNIVCETDANFQCAPVVENTHILDLVQFNWTVLCLVDGNKLFNTYTSPPSVPVRGRPCYIRFRLKDLADGSVVEEISGKVHAVIRPYEVAATSL